MKKFIGLVFISIMAVILMGCVENVGNKTTVDNSTVDNSNTNGGSDSNSTGGTHVDSNSTLEVPTFNGNSQGKLVVQCDNDIMYFIGAYDCLKPDTKPTVTASAGDLVITEELVHVGEVFYTKGYVEKIGTVTVTMKVFSGGVTLQQTWAETCN